MKKLKLILTSSAILIAVAAAIALRETKQDSTSIIAAPAPPTHLPDSCDARCK